MIKLTDLEIRKEISMMELKRQFPEAKTIEFNERQNCFWVEAVGFTSWPLLNPLTDDALCFQLMVKYKVDIEHFKCGTVSAYMSDSVHGEIIEINVNKAICLAIIEAHKENV